MNRESSIPPLLAQAARSNAVRSPLKYQFPQHNPLFSIDTPQHNPLVHTEERNAPFQPTPHPYRSEQHQQRPCAGNMLFQSPVQTVPLFTQQTIVSTPAATFHDSNKAGCITPPYQTQQNWNISKDCHVRCSNVSAPVVTRVLEPLSCPPAGRTPPPNPPAFHPVNTSALYRPQESIPPPHLMTYSSSSNMPTGMCPDQSNYLPSTGRTTLNHDHQTPTPSYNQGMPHTQSQLRPNQNQSTSLTQSARGRPPFSIAQFPPQYHPQQHQNQRQYQYHHALQGQENLTYLPNDTKFTSQGQFAAHRRHVSSFVGRDRERDHTPMPTVERRRLPTLPHQRSYTPIPVQERDHTRTPVPAWEDGGRSGGEWGCTPPRSVTPSRFKTAQRSHTPPARANQSSQYRKGPITYAQLMKNEVPINTQPVPVQRNDLSRGWYGPSSKSSVTYPVNQVHRSTTHSASAQPQSALNSGECGVTTLKGKQSLHSAKMGPAETHQVVTAHEPCSQQLPQPPLPPTCLMPVNNQMTNDQSMFESPIGMDSSPNDGQAIIASLPRDNIPHSTSFASGGERGPHAAAFMSFISSLIPGVGSRGTTTPSPPPSLAQPPRYIKRLAYIKNPQSGHVNEVVAFFPRDPKNSKLAGAGACSNARLASRATSVAPLPTSEEKPQTCPYGYGLDNGQVVGATVPVRWSSTHGPCVIQPSCSGSRLYHAGEPDKIVSAKMPWPTTDGNVADTRPKYTYGGPGSVTEVKAGRGRSMGPSVPVEGGRKNRKELSRWRDLSRTTTLSLCESNPQLGIVTKQGVKEFKSGESETTCATTGSTEGVMKHFVGYSVTDIKQSGSNGIRDSNSDQVVKQEDASLLTVPAAETANTALDGEDFDLDMTPINGPPTTPKPRPSSVPPVAMGKLKEYQAMQQERKLRRAASRSDTGQIDEKQEVPAVQATIADTVAPKAHRAAECVPRQKEPKLALEGSVYGQWQSDKAPIPWPTLCSGENMQVKHHHIETAGQVTHSFPKPPAANRGSLGSTHQKINSLTSTTSNQIGNRVFTIPKLPLAQIHTRLS
eukprot:GHVN01051934.1.p1 GENE.GHVN01051934.1~~GHVN01051934.1.p1  ORF type:complete len:1055 (+),score=130.95 GHVN01051934.1:1168-4332(+)